MQSIVFLILLISWMAGVVIAKGFWSTLLAAIVPFWAYYLVVEQYVVRYL